MSEIIITQKNNIVTIADAIRNKVGKTSSMSFNEIIQDINDFNIDYGTYKEVYNNTIELAPLPEWDKEVYPYYVINSFIFSPEELLELGLPEDTMVAMLEAFDKPLKANFATNDLMADENYSETFNSIRYMYLSNQEIANLFFEGACPFILGSNGSWVFASKNDSIGMVSIDGLPFIYSSYDIYRFNGILFIAKSEEPKLVNKNNILSVVLPKGRSRGDVNGNGLIDEEDVSLILQSQSGTIDLDEISSWCGDVNLDGEANSSDGVAIQQYLAKNQTVLTSTPTLADYYGNWTYLKVDNTNGYFYYDIPAENITSDLTASLSVDSYADCFLGVECLDGVVRIKTKSCPTSNVKCVISINMIPIKYVEEIPKILFSINSYAYQAEDGMTWGEWCDSDYNIKGYMNFDTMILNRTFKHYIAFEDDTTACTSSQVIEANEKYVHVALPTS